MSVIAKEAFLARVNRGGSCWLWNGTPTMNGYGLFSFRESDKNRKFYAHRFAFECVKGPIPKGMCVLHSCDNRMCVNPDHLWLGTRSDNMADMIAKGRGRWPGAKRHVPFRGRKLTAEQARAIKASTGTAAATARLYGVCAGTVKLIRAGRRWANV